MCFTYYLMHSTPTTTTTQTTCAEHAAKFRSEHHEINKFGRNLLIILGTKARKEGVVCAKTAAQTALTFGCVLARSRC